MPRWTSLLVLTSIALVGCEPGFLLLLDVRSDLVPGIEVDAARLELETEGGTFEQVIQLDRDTPLLDGVRLAELQGLSRGELLAQVFLQQGDQVVAERAVANVLESDQQITVLITRDCRDVVCGEPASETCLGGRCGPSSCTPETPETCEPECRSDADCDGGSACSSPTCDTGLCVEAPDGDACGTGEYCDPDVGCAPDPATDPCQNDPDNTDPAAFGAGTTEDPFILCNGEQLSALADAPDSWALHYRLGGAIDAGALARSIAAVEPFTGSLDGRGNAITGLAVPLFGMFHGTVRDLRIEGEVSDRDGAIGLLAVSGVGAEVTRVTARGAAAGLDQVGMLFGFGANLTLDGCTVELTGDVTGGRNVGGMIGTASNCVGTDLTVRAAAGSEGAAVVANNNDAGGLMGKLNGGELTRASASVDVTGGSDAGGLVGSTTNTCVVTECSASGAVRGMDAMTCTYAGGLIGQARDVQVRRSYATGSVTAVGAVAGGLVGWVDDGFIEDSYATGSTVAGPNGNGDCSTVDTQIYTGGLVSVSIRADITRSWASGEAGGTGPVRGGLLSLGFETSDVTLSFALGQVGTGTDTGGLIGVLDGSSTVATSTWDAPAAGNNALCGRGGAGRGCIADPGIDTAAEPGYFFDPSNPPLDQWDFEAVWEAVPGEPPRLRWQSE